MASVFHCVVFNRGSAEPPRSWGGDNAEIRARSIPPETRWRCSAGIRSSHHFDANVLPAGPLPPVGRSPAQPDRVSGEHDLQ